MIGLYLFFVMCSTINSANSAAPAESVEIRPVIEKYQDFTPPQSADPFIAIWHNRGVQGMFYTSLTSNKISRTGGLSIARKEIDINLNGKTVWTDGIGIYGYDGIDGQLATALLATGKTPESREISRQGMLAEWAIPEKVQIRNGTIVAKRFTNLSGEVLKVGTGIKFVTDQPVVADDQKLPLNYRAFSQVGNEGVLTNVSWTVSDPLKAQFQPRRETDPANIKGYLVPVGPVGVVRITLTGTNTRNQEVNGFIDVEIVAGAVQIVNIETLPPVDK